MTKESKDLSTQYMKCFVSINYAHSTKTQSNIVLKVPRQFDSNIYTHLRLQNHQNPKKLLSDHRVWKLVMSNT